MSLKIDDDPNSRYDQTISDQYELSILEYRPGCQEFGGFCNKNEWMYFVNNRVILFYDISQKAVVSQKEFKSNIVFVETLGTYVFVGIEKCELLTIYNCASNCSIEIDIQCVPLKISNLSIYGTLSVQFLVLSEPFIVTGISISLKTLEHIVFPLSLPTFHEPFSPGHNSETIRKSVRFSKEKPLGPYIRTSYTGEKPYDLKYSILIEDVKLLRLDGGFVTIGTHSGFLLQYNWNTQTELISTQFIIPESKSLDDCNIFEDTCFLVCSNKDIDNWGSVFVSYYHFTSNDIVDYKCQHFCGYEFVSLTKIKDESRTIYFVLLLSNVKFVTYETVVFDVNFNLVSQTRSSILLVGNILSSRFDPMSSTIFNDALAEIINVKDFLFLPKSTCVLSRDNKNKYIVQRMFSSCKLLFTFKFFMNEVLPAFLCCEEMDEKLQKGFREIPRQLQLIAFRDRCSEKELFTKILAILLQFDSIQPMLDIIASKKCRLDYERIKLIVQIMNEHSYNYCIYMNELFSTSLIDTVRIDEVDFAIKRIKKIHSFLSLFGFIRPDLDTYEIVLKLLLSLFQIFKFLINAKEVPLGGIMTEISKNCNWSLTNSFSAIIADGFKCTDYLLFKSKMRYIIELGHIGSEFEPEAFFPYMRDTFEEQSNVLGMSFYCFDFLREDTSGYVDELFRLFVKYQCFNQRETPYYRGLPVWIHDFINGLCQKNILTKESGDKFIAFVSLAVKRLRPKRSDAFR